MVRRCRQMEDALEYDIFIKPSLERKLNTAEKSDVYRQWLDKDGGKTIDDAFYYLSQAFTRLGMAWGPSAGVNYTFAWAQTLDTTSYAKAWP